jgi:hypothetical protein
VEPAAPAGRAREDRRRERALRELLADEPRSVCRNISAPIILAAVAPAAAL